MDPTNPVDTNQQPVVENQEALEKSNAQKRIDELTAEKYAAARQVEQLTATVAEMLKRQNEAAVAQRPVVAEAIPEGLDPAIAQYLKAQLKATQDQIMQATQAQYWQVQHQMDQSQVAQKYANLPPDVLKDAASRLTGLKQQYGQAASMDDAVALAFFAHAQKQAQLGRAQQFNQMGQPMMQQGAPQQPVAGSTNLVPPSSLPGWDNFDLSTQQKLIDDFEKKGGRLM